MFKLKTGSFRTLEDACISDILDIRRRDALAPLLVLAPSGHIRTRLQTELARHQPGFLNLHILTPRALAERVMMGSSYSEPTISEPAFFHETIRWILSGESGEAIDLKLRQDFGLEGRTIPHGVPAALSATLKDLADSGMLAEAALQAAQEGFLGQEVPEMSATLALYARLVGIFETRRLRTSADLLRRAAGLVPKHPWIQAQKTIFLYGFYDLTGVQLDFLLSLASHPDARVYFPYEAGNPEYVFAEKLLKDPAFTSKVLVDRPLPNAGEGRGEGERPPTEIWSCSGSHDEVWLTAKEILRLQEKGVPFHDMAVIARRLDPYLAPLKDLFTSHRIPYHVSQGDPAGLHPLTKIIRSLLTFDEKNPLAATIKKDLENSPYISSSSFPAVAGAPSASQGLAVGAVPPPHRGGRDGESMDPRPTAAEDDGGSTWSGHIAWASNLINPSIRLPRDANEEEAALLEAIHESLHSLNVLDALGVKISRERFLKTWEEKMDALTMPAPPSNQGVQVLNVLEARGLSFKAVFLLGLNEKSFPRLIREDPFLSDKARTALAATLGVRLANKMDGYPEERMLFALMQASASDHLMLLTQRSDEEGKTLIPSIYLQEHLRRVHGKANRLSRAFPFKFKDPKLRLPPMDAAPKEVSYLMNRAGSSVEDLEALYGALGWEKERFKTLLASQLELEKFQKGILPRDGLIISPELLRPALEAGFSPSAMEDLAECPYQYYASQVLRLKVEDDPAPDGELTNKALGNIFHCILEVFYESFKGTDMEAACQTVFTEFTTSHPPIYPIAWKAAQTMIREILAEFIEEDSEENNQSGFIPTYFEKRLEAYLPELTGGDKVLFHGKPDRIDAKEGPGGKVVRVVDYKTGKGRDFSGKLATQLIKGKYLQLPIYMGLAAQLGKVESASLRMVRPESEDAAPPPLAADFWQTPDAKTLAENVQGLIQIVKSGHFYIEPDTGDWGYCARCAFTRLCRKEHMRTRSRSEWDPVRLANQKRLNRTAEAAPKKGKKSHA